MSHTRLTRLVTKQAKTIDNLKAELEHQRKSMKPFLMEQVKDATLKAQLAEHGMEKANTTIETLRKELRSAAVVQANLESQLKDAEASLKDATVPAVQVA